MISAGFIDTFPSIKTFPPAMTTVSPGNPTRRLIIVLPLCSKATMSQRCGEESGVTDTRSAGNVSPCAANCDPQLEQWTDLTSLPDLQRKAKSHSGQH